MPSKHTGIPPQRSPKDGQPPPPHHKCSSTRTSRSYMEYAAIVCPLPKEASALNILHAQLGKPARGLVNRPSQPDGTRSPKPHSTQGLWRASIPYLIHEHSLVSQRCRQHNCMCHGYATGSDRGPATCCQLCLVPLGPRPTDRSKPPIIPYSKAQTTSLWTACRGAEWLLWSTPCYDPRLDPRPLHRRWLTTIRPRPNT